MKFIIKDLYKLTKTLKIIHVGHTFCKDCITTWFERQKTCPQCRRDIAIRPIPAYTVELQGEKKKDTLTLMESRSKKLSIQIL